MNGSGEAGGIEAVGIGGLLRQARLARGLSVQEAADLAEVSPSRISQVERAETAGTLQLDTLDRFAGALGYRFAYELVPAASPEVDHDLPVLAAEAVGGPYRSGTLRVTEQGSPFEDLIARGLAVPATRSLRDLPPPMPLSPEAIERLGGRTVSELLIEERESYTL
jgi:transcriptional regulator with XRE-family HTH domain